MIARHGTSQLTNISEISPVYEGEEVANSIPKPPALALRAAWDHLVMANSLSVSQGSQISLVFAGVYWFDMSKQCASNRGAHSPHSPSGVVQLTTARS